MTERLTDEQLRTVARSFTEQSIEAAAVNEALALRARVAKLEAALKDARPFVNMSVTQGQADASSRWYDKAVAALAKLDAALKDAPQ